MVFFEAIKASCHGQGFHGPFVEAAGIDALGEVKDGFVCPLAFALFDDFFHCSGASTFDGGHAKSNFAGGVYRKPTFGFIDVGSQHGDAHAAAFFHEKGHLRDVIHVIAQHGGHVFGGVICLQISRLVGNPRVASGV